MDEMDAHPSVHRPGGGSTGAVACGRGPLSGHDQQLRALLRMVPRRREPKPADRAVARMAARDARRARASVRPRATVVGPVLTMHNRCPLAGSFAKSSSLPGPRKVRTGTALLLCAVVAAARAQSPVERPASADPDLLLNLPYSMRLELGPPSSPGWSAGTGSAVLTSNHRLRMLEERTQQQTRYGLNLVDQATSRSHLLLQFPGGRPLAGLQYERKNFLFEGDQLSIRSTSDIQTLARGLGLSGTQVEGDALSLLGWRSHSRLAWELGDPTRELQWRFSASIDRRVAVQKSAVSLQMLRRF